MQRVEIDYVIKSDDGSLSQFVWLEKALLRGFIFKLKSSWSEGIICEGNQGQ